MEEPDTRDPMERLRDPMERLRNDYRRIRKKMIYNKLEKVRIMEITETVNKYFELAEVREDWDPKIKLLSVSHTNATNYFGRDDVVFDVTLHIKRSIYFGELLELNKKLSKIGLVLTEMFPRPYTVTLRLFEKCEK